MNRRSFLTGAASVATMGKSKLSLSPTKIITGIGSNFRPHIIEEHQVLHLYEFLGKTLPDYYIDLDNVDSQKIIAFQKGLLKTLGNSHFNAIKKLGNIGCFEDLEYWMIETYMQDYEITLGKYHNWFQGLPSNIKKNILSQNDNGLSILFNEDSLIDNAICSIEGFESPSEKSLFSYLKTGGKVRKGNIDIEFSFDSRDYNERWKYRLINNSIREGTHEITLNNPSELSQILEMPESSLKEIMNKTEKIKLKEEKKESKKIEKDNTKVKKNISSFKSFLLGTTYVTNITEYTKNQSQEILDYIDEKEIKNLIKID